MTAQRLTWILALATAMAGTGLACGDDKPSADASVTGGAGGSGGRGGTGGSGGRGGTGGTAGAPATGGTGGSGTDAATTGGAGGAGTGGTGGAGTGGTGGTGGAGGTGGGTDAAADMALPIDMPVDQPLPVDLPPDNPPPVTTVNVTDCAQFMCPQLTSVASQCQANETTCVHSKDSDQTNYCHSNGVKKVARSTFSGASYTTIMEVFKANSGDDCYTLEIRGTGGTPDMQNWTYKSTSGATLATATWRSDTGQLTVRCDNVNYVIGNVGCPGTDGQPDDTGAECPAGTCAEP